MIPGSILQGRYQVLRLIGEGSMGSVYRGERLGLGRPVAIKFLHAGIAHEPQFARRFDVEARAMSRLAHPNCISVIDYGSEGVPYLVMDLVDGKSLRVSMEERSMSPQRAIGIARQILAGLAHAHEQGIIHRDVKPENVLLVQGAGLQDHVRILDFGLAKLRDSSAMLTGNLCLGTPHYMAPEQLREGQGPVDLRVDLYATGVILYEMLTGKKPFDGPEVGHVLIKHLQEPPPPFSTVPGLSLSAALEAVVQRALAKTTSARFATALAMIEALESVPEWCASPPPAARLHAEPTTFEPQPWGADPQAATAVAPAPSRGAILAAQVLRRLRPSIEHARKYVRESVRGKAAPRVVAIWRAARARLSGRPRLAAGAVLGGAALLTVMLVVAPGPDASVRAVGPLLAAAAVAGRAAVVPAGAKLSEVDDLLARGAHAEAVERLRQLRKQHPDDADYAVALARVSFERRRPLEGMSAFRAAIRRDRARRSDSVLIQHVIDTLRSDRFAGAAEELLRDLGNDARLAVRTAARGHASPTVRTRARALLRDWDRRPLFRW